MNEFVYCIKTRMLPINGRNPMPFFSVYNNNITRALTNNIMCPPQTNIN